MPKFQLKKLGRDKGLESFKAENVTVTHTFLNGEVLQKALKEKLIEEAKEVNETLELDEIIEELSDVLEVIDGICKACNINKNKLIQIKEKKYGERGGFQTGLYIESIEMDEDNPRVEHFRASPEKYPEY